MSSALSFVMKSWRGSVVAAALALGWVACSSDASEAPAGKVTDLMVTKVTPLAVVPGSVLVVEGNFLDLKPAFVHLRGSLSGQPMDVLLPAEPKGLGRLEVAWNGGASMGLPMSDGEFVGTVQVTASVPADPREHLSEPQSLTLRVLSQLEPKFYAVEEGIRQVNDSIKVEGDDFLLGAGEGRTVAILEGCFQKQSDTTCKPVPEAVVPLAPETINATPVTQRKLATFPFAPKIAGIEPGLFKGSVRLRSDHKVSGPTSETAQIPIQIQLVSTTLTSFSPPSASLGQFVEITGGGFVGKNPEVDDPTAMTTRIQLVGTFTATGAPSGKPVTLELITEYVSGRLVRYVLNEEDALGQAADLRTVTGVFKGTAKPVATYGSQTVTGGEILVSLGISPVKQVVWVNWMPTYKDSLEHLGLRAADQRIRDRIIEVMGAIYLGVNLQLVTEEPRDFKLYARVDLEGPDPNGLGLLGYDNTAGKDVGNDRLQDRIGGVNAVTQEGGYPGYGGVFIDSLIGFSEHPGKFAEKLEVADPLFDQIFDPFRPDRGGKPVLAEELAVNVPVLQDGSGCPASKSDRKMRIACAIWVLGSLVGTTAGHEVGHSLGLADPEGEEFHNAGDAPNRLMDSGGARSFRERAELGEGPGVFCDAEYKYLKKILPNPVPDPVGMRPSCD
ncbi:MAG: hypothetical protein IT375_01820 [Polyangiaceae bacterium]|nr:hypothetical protein [Polyangiaceae bacterium]